MTTNRHTFLRRLLGISTLLALFGASGCVNAIDTMVVADAVKPADEAAQTVDYGESQECLARAMYFESNRSSESGMLAVGTVVMNRVSSPNYPSSVCGVVGQRRQFAPGVMTRAMGPGKDLAMKTAYAVLSGKRHAGVKTAKFFHTAGMKFAYRNMHYVAIAGGNAFYQKIGRKERQEIRMASQADVRARQKAGDDVAITTDVTAVALAPKADNSRQNSPFSSLWQALTEKTPSARSPAAEEMKTASTAGKGGRVVAEAEATTDDEAATLADRMNGVPGVSFADSSSGAGVGDVTSQIRGSFADER